VNRKLLLIVHLSYFLFATYIIALLKQSFQQSRPIWYDSRISNWEWFCPKDFGNPSGHSFAVIMLYEPILSDSIGYGGSYRPFSFVLLLFMVMIPISRMYLGVHSLNQILFGLSMGTVFLVLFKYVYQRALYELFWKFLLGEKRKIKFVGVFILHILTIVIPIIFYQINHDQRPML
jgi:undecaprenyl-diphosphatase